MTAAQPETPVTEAVRSLEVRWIVPGHLETEVIDWFARFRADTESRDDAYLLQPQMRGLSVKLRRGGPLEVKVYGGSPGVLDVAGRANGRMESWQKWSFPYGQRRRGSAVTAGWTLVRKRRRVTLFPLASGRDEVRVPGPGRPPGCAVELTEVSAYGEPWWSLGFETTGPPGTFRRELEAAAALVFAEAPPGGEVFSSEHSTSYADWLYRWPGTG